MESVSLASLAGAFMVVALLAFVFIPFVRILQRAGRSGWWAIFWLVPGANIIGLWLFAFTRWPALDGPKNPG